MTCVCRHDNEEHNGPQYSTGLATHGPGCDLCACAYFAPTGAIEPRPSIDEDAAILFIAAMVGVLVGVVLAVLIGP